MRVLKMFAVKDTCAGAFHPPFVAHTEGTAVRTLRDVMRRGDHAYALNPADYVLFEVGVFDEDSGVCEGVEQRHILTLSSLLEMGD